MNKRTAKCFWLMTVFLTGMVPVACGPASERMVLDDPIDPEKHLLLESTLEIKHEPGGCILAVLSSSPTTT
jgi:hypothetical protein